MHSFLTQNNLPKFDSMCPILQDRKLELRKGHSQMQLGLELGPAPAWAVLRLGQPFMPPLVLSWLSEH